MITMRIPIFSLIAGALIITASSLLIREPFAVGFLSILTVTVVSIVGVLSIRHQYASDLMLRSVLIILVGISLLVLGLTNLPLKIVFPIFKPKFDALAQQLLAGKKLDFPIWVGPFRLADGGIRDGSGAPYLMTNGDLGEIDAFVQDPKGTHFNIWSVIKLSGSWSYVAED